MKGVLEELFKYFDKLLDNKRIFLFSFKTKKYMQKFNVYNPISFKLLFKKYVLREKERTINMNAIKKNKYYFNIIFLFIFTFWINCVLEFTEQKLKINIYLEG